MVICPVWLLADYIDLAAGISPQGVGSPEDLAVGVFLFFLLGASKNSRKQGDAKQWDKPEMEHSDGPFSPRAGSVGGVCPEALWWPPALLAPDDLCVLQVGLGKKKCLYALEEGIVRYTKEVYVPSPSNSEAVDLVTSLPRGAVLYKTFVHVVPAKPEGTFKLVAML